MDGNITAGIAASTRADAKGNAPAERARRERAAGRPLSIVMVGHVDHGKSTLIGRLLHETDSLPEGRLAQLAAASRRRGMEFEWSFVMDALKAERDQGITIDTARVRFNSNGRSYLVIDAPGHAEFIKNMLTGAAAAEAAILVVDVVEGMSEQTRRHAFLLQLLGLREVIVAVNKMDRCDHAQAAFERAAVAVSDYLAQLAIAPAAIIPISARDGDMIRTRSSRLDWYTGPTLLEGLEALGGKRGESESPLRLPVQDVYKFDERRIVVGRIESGRLRVGDRLRFTPGEREARITSLETWNAQSLVSAAAGQSVGLILDQDIFVERGQVASAPEAAPQVARRLRLRLFHFGRVPLQPSDAVKVQLGLAETAGVIERIEHVIDVNTLTRCEGRAIGRNDIAEIILRTSTPLAVDAAGTPLGRGVLRRGHEVVGGFLVGEALDARTLASARMLTPAQSAVGATERQALWGHGGGVLWLTGLSGAGKSTLAVLLEAELVRRGWRAQLLDGDALRRTLNSDLGFSEAERAENVRRIGCVAQLLGESGVLAIVACIAPRAAQRMRLRAELGPLFHEVYLKAPLSVCERRDVKGLYTKARRGEIPSFTGLSDPYEPPETPELGLATDELSPGECLAQLLRYVERAFAAQDAERLAS